MTQLTVQMTSGEARHQLPSLERLLNELFGGCTSPQRKQDIQNTLREFSFQSTSWCFALHALQDSSSEYVIMFCFSVLEQVLARRWMTSDASLDRSQIRQFLWQYLLNHASEPISIGPGTPPNIKSSPIVPAFALSKCCKLLASIVQHEWPETYPNFFQDVYALIERSATSSAGLQLLQITLEELTQPREELLVSRRQQLLKQLTNELEPLLCCLEQSLQRCLNQLITYVNTTPPPSPTHDGNSVSNDNNNTVISPICAGSQHACVQMISTAFQLFKNSPVDQIQSRMPLSQSQLLRLAGQTLHCLNALFSWLPVSHCQRIQPQLLSSVFVFSTFGCGCADAQPLGYLAMGCVNEVISKHCVQSTAAQLYLHTFERTFHLLRTIIAHPALMLTTGTSTDPKSNNSLFAQLDERYLGKFVDFLRLFISNHLTHYRNDAQRLNEFLQLLYEFTFRFGFDDQFLQALDLWNLLLDQLDLQTLAQQQQYHEALRTLSTQLLYRLQSRYNAASLSQLDRQPDSDIDDGSESEFDRYIRLNLHLIARIAQLLPEHVVQLAHRCLDETLVVYSGLQQLLVPNTSNVTEDQWPRMQLQDANEQQLNELHHSLEDYLLAIRLVENLAPLFMDDHFQARFVPAQRLIARMLHALQYTQHCRISECHCTHKGIQQTLVRIHVAQLQALHAYVAWFRDYLLNSAPLGEPLPMPQNNAENGSSAKFLGSDHNALPVAVSGDCYDHRQCMEMLEHLLKQLVITVLRTAPHLTTESQSLIGNLGPLPFGSVHDCVLQASIECLNSICVQLRHPSALLLWPIQILFELCMETVNPLWNNESNGSNQLRPSQLRSMCEKRRSPPNCHLSQCTHTPNLKSSACDKLTLLQLEVKNEQQLLAALLSWLVLPSQRLSDAQQQWEKRAEAAQRLMNALLQPICEPLQTRPELALNPDEFTGLTDAIRRTLRMITELLTNHTHSHSRSKQLLFGCVQPVLQHLLQMLQSSSLLLHPRLGEPMLACLCTMLDVLRGQVPVTTVSVVIEALLRQVRESPQLSGSVQENALDWSSSNTDSRVPLLQRICSLFVLLVEQPNAGNRQLLAQLIRVTLEQLLPLVGHCNDTDLATTFYDFLYKLLLNNGKYFNSETSSNVSAEPLLSNLSASNEALQRCSEPEQQLIHIIHIFGQSFLQPEPALCKQNFHALCVLQGRQRLFHRSVFKAFLLGHFLSLCLHVLLTQAHHLLQEELLVLLHQLASVDYSIFSGQCRKLLRDEEKPLPDAFRIQLDQLDLLNRSHVDDLPSFSQTMLQFINDVRYYRLISN